MWLHGNAPPYESCLMTYSANVVDFNSYRKRRQARVMAELMWAMYTARAGVANFTVMTTGAAETRQA